MRSRFLTAQPQQNLLTPFSELPPVAGMDDNVPLFRMPEGTAVYLYNIIPGSYGAVTREGYLIWAVNLAGGAVKGLVPFAGKESGSTPSRLFASTSNGIYNITARGADNPTADVVYSDQTADAGFTHYHHFTDATGSQTVFVADSKNGLYEYNPVGPTWTKYTATEIQGVDPTKIAFVAGHKGRLWFIERDSADAWYLPIGQKQGLATKFQIGSKFRHGGELVGLYTWTIDGGRGVDDYLVAVSRAGDVLAYQGTDPSSSATWGLRGSWFIGKVPKGRRVALESGGDLAILSVFGATSVSSLLQGLEPTRIDRNITGKVSNLIQRELRGKIDQDYWQFALIPEEEVIIVNVPRNTGERHIQFGLNTNRLTEGSGGGWGFWRDVPATVFEPYLGNAYFGTEDGRVCQMSGSVDEVPFTNDSGRPVEFSTLGRFTDYGVPAYYKQVQYIRPSFQSDNLVNFSAKAVYDFDISEIIPVPSTAVGFGDLWDAGRWDQAVWSGSEPRIKLTGGNGYGRNVAIAIRGEAISRTTLLNIDGGWQPWNIL